MRRAVAGVCRPAAATRRFGTAFPWRSLSLYSFTRVLVPGYGWRSAVVLTENWYHSALKKSLRAHHLNIGAQSSGGEVVPGGADIDSEEADMFNCSLCARHEFSAHQQRLVLWS